MNAVQEQHLAELKKSFAVEFDAKYRAGAKEHGTILSDYPASLSIHHGLEEVLDLWAYLKSAQVTIERDARRIAALEAEVERLEAELIQAKESSHA